MARIAERYNTPEALEAIKATLEFLGNDSAGLTLEDLHDDLFQKQIVGDFGSFKRWIYQLEREGTLERRENPKQRNIPLFHLTGYSATQPSLFDDFVLRSEVEREVKSSQDLYTADEVERERQSISVLHDIASGHAQETTFAKLIRNIATSLANENPVDLILEIAEWVKNDINALARKARHADQNHKPELRGLTRDLGFRRIKAVLFFQRLWRFDKSIKQASGIMDIPSVQQMMGGSEVTLDLNRARLRLQERVFGDKVIAIVSIETNVGI